MASSSEASLQPADPRVYGRGYISGRYSNTFGFLGMQLANCGTSGLLRRPEMPQFFVNNAAACRTSLSIANGAPAPDRLGRYSLGAFCRSEASPSPIHRQHRPQVLYASHSGGFYLVGCRGLPDSCSVRLVGQTVYLISWSPGEPLPALAKCERSWTLANGRRARVASRRPSTAGAGRCPRPEVSARAEALVA